METIFCSFLSIHNLSNKCYNIISETNFFFFFSIKANNFPPTTQLKKKTINESNQNE